jgi:hypothetical protein
MGSSRVLPLGSAEAAISAYRDAGGVVEYVLLSPGDGDTGHRHQEAAVGAVEEIANRWEAWVVGKMVELGRPRSSFGTIEVEASRAAGQPITPQAFAGRAYDWTSERVVSMWEGSGKVGAGQWMTDGYAEAFSDPPYRLSASPEQMNQWFQSINRLLFGGIDQDLIVWSWSTDWSTWFDAGTEWWGSYLWTVERPGLPWIAVIGASQTD